MKPRELEKPFVSKRKGNQNAQSGVYCTEKKKKHYGRKRLPESGKFVIQIQMEWKENLCVQIPHFKR